MADDEKLFKTWLEDVERQENAALKAVANMKKHEWFSAFCEAVGCGVDEWGQDPDAASSEVMLFEEWLAETEKKLEQRRPLEGESLAIRSADVAANAETQIHQMAFCLQFSM